MHDIRAIRENPAAFDAALSRRGLAAMSDRILSLDANRRARIVAAETAQADQNRASKDVGAAKARGDEAEFERLRALVADKKAEVARLFGIGTASTELSASKQNAPMRQRSTRAGSGRRPLVRVASAKPYGEHRGRRCRDPR